MPEKDLPVELPYDVDFAPRGKPPLATAEDWVKVKCPNCGGEARREVETMDTFVDSSWYFLGYLRDATHKSNKSNMTNTSQKLPWDPNLVKAWMPVDVYFGGAEHTLGHTLYSRFFVKFLHDAGYLTFSEYAKKRVIHGVILGPDGSRMSKSRGNVVNPDKEVKKYGADTVRLYLAFLGPYDLVAPWNPSGIKGVHNFLKRVWRLVTKWSENSENSVTQKTQRARKSEKSEDKRIRNPGKSESLTLRNTEYSESSEQMMHKTIRKVGEDIEVNKFNTAIAALMTWLNFLEKKESEPVTGPAARHPHPTSSPALDAFISKRSFDSLTTEELTREGLAEGARRGAPTRITRDEIETLLLLLAPFAPHMCEELYQQFFANSKLAFRLETRTMRATRNSKFQSIHIQLWPKYDAKLVQEARITLVVQVNGKVRDKIEVKSQISREEAENLAADSPKIKKYIDGKSYRIIFVPGRLINFVTQNT